jgi:hypothetical protein
MANGSHPPWATPALDRQLTRAFAALAEAFPGGQRDGDEVTCHDCGERFRWDGQPIPPGFVPCCDACELAEPIDLDARYTLA